MSRNACTWEITECPNGLPPVKLPTVYLRGPKQVEWAINPVTGERRCVGSTTRLTDAGMRVYILQVEAFAAEKFGVVFTTHQEPVGRIA